MFKLAILFWFYKDVRVCENRLKLIKKYNPNLKIFGLYGGEEELQEVFKTRLGKYLDDFYTSPIKDPKYKWIHGDLMILEWFESRGKNLDWDSIVVAQWDLLVFDSLENQFKDLKKGEIFLSGFRELVKEIENDWDWTKPGKRERKNYLNFLEHVKKEYNYNEKPLCCLFIIEVFPRKFFEKYAMVKDREVGMLEYKVPIYAKIFNIPFFEKDLGVYWDGNWKDYPLNAMPYKISKKFINEQLKKKGGWRLFHPYFKSWE